MIEVPQNTSEGVLKLVSFLDAFLIDLVKADQIEDADKRLAAFVAVGAEYEMLDAENSIQIANNSL